MTEYRVPIHAQILRPFLRPLFRMLFRILGRVRVIGAQHVPRKQAYVVAINHISIFDPPLAVAFWPETAEVIGAADVFQKKGQGPLLKMYGVIPVHRGEYDRALMDKVLSVLKAGRPLIMAPEGGRSHEPAMRRAMPGIGYIIEHSGVPVIPVGLVGTTDDFWQRSRRGERPQLEMRIGRPIDFPPMTVKGAQRRAMRQKYADIVMSHIAGLLPPEYRGVYADSAIFA
jgi:1-acyl-sn-glycerol-3-phosphate acyltransferase